MAMIDWQKDCVQTMWHLSVLERRKRNFRLTEDERQDMIALLKDNVARYVRMATQKTAGQRGNVGDLDFDTIDMTAMTYEEYKAIGRCPRCGKEPFGIMCTAQTACTRNAVDAARRKAMRTDAPKAGNWRVNNLPSKQKPGADHPWRKYNKLIFERRAATVE